MQFVDLYEHPFICRLSDLCVVQLSFETWSDVEKYEDVLYTLLVGGWTDKLSTRVRSFERIEEFLDHNLSEIGKTNPATILEMARDALHLRLVSVLDILNLVVNVVFELNIENKSATFGNISRKVADKRVLRPLGVANSKLTTVKDDRDARVHHGTERTHDENDDGFRVAALWETWGRRIVMHDQKGNVIPLTQMYDSRRHELTELLRNQFLSFSNEIHEVLDICSNEFEARFSKKIAAPNSFMTKFKTSKLK